MTQASTAPVEYTVYTFEPPSPSRQKGDAPWKRQLSSLDRDIAVSEAQKLLRTRRFDRIEIKKKFFDPKKNRIVDGTYKILRHHRKWPPFKKALTLVVGGELIALGACLLIYLP